MNVKLFAGRDDCWRRPLRLQMAIQESPRLPLEFSRVTGEGIFRSGLYGFGRQRKFLTSFLAL